MKYEPVIPKDDLLDGVYYEGRCRNATIARWWAEHDCFYHWRNKFGFRYVEAIRCPEDDEKFDVFIAERVLFDAEEEIPIPKELPIWLKNTQSTPSKAKS